MKNVAIVGLGLLGTSMAMALKDKGIRRLGWTRRGDVRKSLLEKGVIDETADNPDDLLAKADIAVLCLPVPAISEFCAEHAEAFKPNSIVTDIGSVKRVVMRKASEALADSSATFIGSHPMAGTEKTGPDAAFPELYRNAIVFVTPPCGGDPARVRELNDFWKTLDTKPIPIDPDEHDRLVAFTSHISHMIALALTNAVLASAGGERGLRGLACCGAFRDCSRVASSSPAMWREIIERNTENVVDALKGFKHELETLIEAISDGRYDDFENMFADAKKIRDAWMAERYPNLL